jgi:Fe-S-cluster containining protein
MSWVDEICLSCGVCCTTLSIVRIQPEDIERLMQGYNLTREQAHRMVRRDENGFTILMDRTAACPALSSKAGHYMCHAYEHRPATCREYECYILAFTKDWMEKRGASEKVEERNPFHSVQDEEELYRRVQNATKRLREDFLSECSHYLNGESHRPPDHLPELMKTLSGAEFENTFPPPSLVQNLHGRDRGERNTV